MGNASLGGLAIAEVSPSVTVTLGGWSSFGSFKEGALSKGEKLAKSKKEKAHRLT